MSFEGGSSATGEPVPSSSEYTEGEVDRESDGDWGGERAALFSSGGFGVDGVGGGDGGAPPRPRRAFDRGLAGLDEPFWDSDCDALAIR